MDCSWVLGPRSGWDGMKEAGGGGEGLSMPGDRRQVGRCTAYTSKCGGQEKG